MELISLNFALLLAAILCTYYVVGRLLPRAQWVVLLAGSMVFYGFAGGWKLLAYVFVIAFETWGASLLLHKLSQDGRAARKAAKGRDAKKAVRASFDRKRRALFWCSLAFCFCILGYFKYWNVFIYYAGFAESIYSLGILLPLGMSFYIFQSLAYLIDSYNEKFEPQRNFARYLLFVSYFPQMVQGPINRYDALAPQLFEPHAPNLAGMQRGLLRLGFGMLKKIAIANVLADVVYVIFDVSGGPDIPASLALWGVFAYSMQMYADFSGGIDLVEGASELFGIQMATNFRQPYLSVSLADFWRRWHMSLGAFMRDYVFYPLAVTTPMRRFGKWSRKHLSKHVGRTLPACISNVLVFLFVGLWHGAEIHFLAWGLYNGVVVALADLFAPVFDRMVERLHIRREARGFYVFSVVRTFVVVCVGRFFDRFAHIGDAIYAIRNVLLGAGYVPVQDALAAHGAVHAAELGFPAPTIAAILFVFVVDVCYERGRDVRATVLGWRLPARALLYLAVVLVAAAAVGFDTTGGGGGFLYANF